MVSIGVVALLFAFAVILLVWEYRWPWWAAVVLGMIVGALLWSFEVLLLTAAAAIGTKLIQRRRGYGRLHEQGLLDRLVQRGRDAHIGDAFRSWKDNRGASLRSTLKAPIGRSLDGWVIWAPGARRSRRPAYRPSFMRPTWRFILFAMAAATWLVFLSLTLGVLVHVLVTGFWGPAPSFLGPTATFGVLALVASVLVSDGEFFKPRPPRLVYPSSRALTRWHFLGQRERLADHIIRTMEDLEDNYEVLNGWIDTVPGDVDVRKKIHQRVWEDLNCSLSDSSASVHQLEKCAQWLELVAEPVRRMAEKLSNTQLSLAGREAIRRQEDRQELIDRLNAWEQSIQDLNS